jgi:hypothetical protein
VDFKYNEELTQTFMSSNQIGGFFNRLEASRKYLFGSLGVLGKPNDSIISGVFIARGPDIAPVVTVAPDWESYSYEAISLDNEEQKKFFEAALAWDLEIDGKAWADGKNVSLMGSHQKLHVLIYSAVQVNASDLTVVVRAVMYLAEKRSFPNSLYDFHIAWWLHIQYLPLVVL